MLSNLTNKPNAYQRSKRKIVIELIGGTGNQLFQLSACVVLADIHNRIPYFTDRLLDGNRNLETIKVAKKLKIKYISSEEIKEWPLLKENDLIHPAYFSQYPEKDYLPNKDIVISGYFQNYRIHKFRTIKKIRELAIDTFKNISFNNDSNFIAVHTRELQASNNNKPLKGIDNLDFKYYERSFKLINKLIKNKKPIKKVYVFTDMFKNKGDSNIIYKLEKLVKSYKYKLVFGDDLCSSAWESISIMSQAKYIITSNSTFSWWGGYLSKAKVISPILSLWETRLLTPDNWIQINDGNLSPYSWHRQNFYKKQVIKLKKRQDNNKFIRKIKHIFTYYFIQKTFFNFIFKYIKLKIRNILN